MPVGMTHDALAPVRAIMERHRVHCSPEEFQAAVNITFHNFEAEVYDREHSDMWESLPREFARLAEDCAEVAKYHGEFHLLDIGCGTGLATDCMLKTVLGSKIASVDLLDTSQIMLAKARERAAGWGIRFSIKEGLLGSVPTNNKYSLIVTCSVLHHVPDVPDFLRCLRALQADRGIFIHLQDPNGEYLNDPEYLKRVKVAEPRKFLLKRVARFTPKRILGRIYRELRGTQHESYCDRTNRELLKSGVIETPLSVSEIYAITDIHVMDGQGISVRIMKDCMPDYDLVSQRSYAFFGKLSSELPVRLKKIEEDLADKNALNGLHIGAAWKLR